MEKKYISLGILALLLVIAVIAWAQLRTPGQPAAQDQSANNTNQLVKTEVAENKLPNKFPADLPIEQGAKIVQNYNATAPDGRFQATRAFETKQTLAANLKIYKDYLTNAGFKIQNTIDQPTYKMVFGVKGQTTIQASINQNTVTNVKTVTLNYTEIPIAK